MASVCSVTGNGKLSVYLDHSLDDFVDGWESSKIYTGIRQTTSNFFKHIVYHNTEISISEFCLEDALSKKNREMRCHDGVFATIFSHRSPPSHAPLQIIIRHCTFCQLRTHWVSQPCRGSSPHVSCTTHYSLHLPLVHADPQHDHCQCQYRALLGCQDNMEFDKRQFLHRPQDKSTAAEGDRITRHLRRRDRRR